MPSHWAVSCVFLCEECVAPRNDLLLSVTYFGYYFRRSARVHCLYMVAKGTLDEVLWQLLEKKFQDLGTFS